MDFKKVIYTNIHNAKESVEELADYLGMSTSMLYRCGNPNDEQADLPSRKLIPLMNRTNNFSILRHMARRTGHVVFKVPKAAARSVETLNEFQKTFTVCLDTLLDFYRGNASKEETVGKIDALISAAAGHRKAVEKSDQPDLL